MLLETFGVEVYFTRSEHQCEKRGGGGLGGAGGRLLTFDLDEDGVVHPALLVVGHADVLAGVLLRHVQDLQRLVVVLKLDFTRRQVAALLEPLDGGCGPEWGGGGETQTGRHRINMMKRALLTKCPPSQEAASQRSPVSDAHASRDVDVYSQPGSDALQQQLLVPQNHFGALVPRGRQERGRGLGEFAACR